MEKYYRHTMKKQGTNQLQFQCLDWRDFNDNSNDDEADNSDEKGDDGEKADRFQLYIFGVTEEGESVCCMVKDIPIYFYIKVPETFGKARLTQIIDYIVFKAPEEYKQSIKRDKCYLEKKMDFYGYTNGYKFTFAKLVFDNSQAMTYASRLFGTERKIKLFNEMKEKDEYFTFPTYESNVDPIVRFLHTREIKPSGWITVSSICPVIQDEQEVKEKISTCQIEIETTAEQITAVPEKTMPAPLIQASFDIETFSQYCLSGTVTTSENKLKGDADCIFTKELRIGYTISVNNATRTITKIVSDRLALVDCNWGDNGTKAAEIAVVNIDSARVDTISAKRMFPRPQIDGNYVIQIATAFKRYGSPDFFLKHIITLKQCSPISANSLETPGCEIITESYETEQEVLMAWQKLIQRVDPDILYSYNGDCFDCYYLNERAKKLGIAEEFLQLSRLIEKPAFIKHETFSSGAYGTTHYNRMIMYGRINFDVLILVKREKKLASYKLDDVAFEILKQNKHDVTPDQLFTYFCAGNPDQLRIIAEYCIQDTLLPQRIVDKLDILTNQIEMSNITYVPLRYLLERGQQIKVFSQIVRKTMPAGFLIPHFQQKYWNAFTIYRKGDIVSYRPRSGSKTEDQPLRGCGQSPSYALADSKGIGVIGDTGDDGDQYMAIEESKDSPPIQKHEKSGTMKINKACWIVYKEAKFKGATVFEPKIGLHDLITTLDFASLYPSIIRDNCLCYSTIVLDKDYANVPGVEYISVSNAGLAGNAETKASFSKFVQNTNAIMPNLLKELLENRKRVKKAMETEKDPLKKSIMNSTQLAYKISANSAYGFFASNMLTCKQISSAVTTIGRKMIEDTKTFCETTFKHHCIKEGLTPPGFQVETVAGDTDSVLLKFTNILPPPNLPQTAEEIKQCKLEKSFELGKLCGKMATKTLFNKTGVVSLDFEKCYFPLVTLGKKRYIGNLYSTPKKPDYVDCKGIELKRRDSSVLVKVLYQRIIDIIMEKSEAGVPDAIKYIQTQLERLITGDFSLDHFVITKSLRDQYKIKAHPSTKNNYKINDFFGSSSLLTSTPITMSMAPDATEDSENGIEEKDDENDQVDEDEIDVSEMVEETVEKRKSAETKRSIAMVHLPHVQLAEKMKKRDYGTAPVSGSRMNLVFIEDGSVNAKTKTPLYLRAEDPEYIVEYNKTAAIKIKPDIEYYIQNQIRNPLTQILTVIDPNLNVANLFDDYVAKYQSKRLGARDIRAFFATKPQ